MVVDCAASSVGPEGSIPHFARMPYQAMLEEVKHVRLWNGLLKRYEESSGRPSSISGIESDEEAERIATVLSVTTRDWYCIASRGVLARNRILLGNLGLVTSLVEKFVIEGVDCRDLVQEACAYYPLKIANFDPEKGFQFSTYVAYPIRQAAHRFLLRSRTLVTLPITAAQTAEKIRKYRRDYFGFYGCHPSKTKIARALELNLKRVEQLWYFQWPTLSLNFVVDPYHNTELLDVLEDRVTPSPEEAVDLSILQHDIRRVMNLALSDFEAEVVSYLYGINNARELTYGEVGDLFGMSRDKVRSLHSRCLRKMRRYRNLLKDHL